MDYGIAASGASILEGYLVTMATTHGPKSPKEWEIAGATRRVPLGQTIGTPSGLGAQIAMPSENFGEVWKHKLGNSPDSR